MSLPVYPFVAIVGQYDLKLGLILSVIAPSSSGILIRGEKGTAKSTAVRALAELLPHREEVKDSPYHLSAAEYHTYRDSLLPDLGDDPEVVRTKVPVVELPVGATEDRVVGTLDLERALHEGRRHFEPGLLAAAHRGLLYVDEVNLLDDHIVDLLLDAAAMGLNTVEREGISLSHPAEFSLVGTMNPEEGELRPQLLDRFGLCVTVTGSTDVAERVQVMRRRSQFEADPREFIERYQAESDELSNRISDAIGMVDEVTISDDMLREIAQASLDARVDGHRADVMMMRVAIAYAAWQGRLEVTSEDVRVAAHFTLPHRIRRGPLDEISSWSQA